MDKQAPVVEWIIAENDADWERLRGRSPAELSPPVSRHSLLRYCWCGAALLLMLATGGYWWRSVRAGSHQAEAESAARAQPELGVVTPVPTPMFASHTGSLTDASWWLQHVRKVAGMPTAVQATEPDAYSDGPLATASPADQNSMAWWAQNGRIVSGLRAAVQIADPKAHQDIELHTVEFQGEQAVARVVTYTDHGAAHRQTRFYRRTGAGWRQTEPDAALWGPERSLETPSLLYHFRQNDAQAVIAVTPQIEELYATLRRNFGLPSTQLVGQPFARIGEKLVIEVSVTQPPGAALPWFGVHDPIRVPSPAVYLAPVELTDAELLAQSIALPLIKQMSAQASEQHRIGTAWQPLTRGLRLWQVWDTSLPLAVWRQEIVQWIDRDLPSAASEQQFVLPEQYEELCASHALWMEAPTMLGIPLLCSGSDREARYFGIWRPRHPPARLDQLAVPVRDDYAPEGTPIWGQTVALATLIDYAVTTYGRERLPALVAGLGQYDSWETLIPAIFAVSPAEFERGWQEYLAAQYGLSLDTVLR